MTTSQHSDQTPQQGWGGMSLLWRFAWTLTFNTVIAGFLTSVGYGGEFTVNLVFSQCIGLSIMAMFRFVATDRPWGLRYALSLTLAVAGGGLIGTLLAMLITGVAAQAPPGLFWRTLLLALLFGGVASYFFMSRERWVRAQAQLQEQELRHLQAQKGQVEMQLRLLQAQTEPHFLFNTLAHVLSLMESKPERGKRMLEHLIDYLRNSLVQARRAHTTLADEVDLLKDYLELLRIRMGERLRYRIELPEELGRAKLPPMLLQPLVENAIKHGLEPKIEGGELWLHAQAEAGALQLEVGDTGLGFSKTGNGTGVGLANLRERLSALYGEAAELCLEPRPAGGVIARLRLPLENT